MCLVTLTTDHDGTTLDLDDVLTPDVSKPWYWLEPLFLSHGTGWYQCSLAMVVAGTAYQTLVVILYILYSSLAFKDIPVNIFIAFALRILSVSYSLFMLNFRKFSLFISNAKLNFMIQVEPYLN